MRFLGKGYDFLASGGGGGELAEEERALRVLRGPHRADGSCPSMRLKKNSAARREVLREETPSCGLLAR